MLSAFRDSMTDCLEAFLFQYHSAKGCICKERIACKQHASCSFGQSIAAEHEQAAERLGSPWAADSRSAWFNNIQQSPC